MTKIDFADLRAANSARCIEWMDETPSPLNASFHGCELGGEVGEALNIIKKFDRTLQGIPGAMSFEQAQEKLKEELADVIICTDIIAAAFEINLSDAVQDKFNATSDKHGFKVKFPFGDDTEIPWRD